jgi:O-antigen/teichoic acid export membrane protein
VTQVPGPIKLGSPTLKGLRRIFSDALYRGSLTLLASTVATSAIGFVFWTLAAHAYPPSTVGVFSSVTSGVGLLAAIAALGLPNTMIRHVVGAANPRELVVVAVMSIGTVGTMLCLVTVLLLGPHLPRALHLQQRGSMMLLVTALVAFTAVSGTLDAGLIAMRSSHVVLVKNLAGSIVKVAALLLLVRLQSSGLLISYGLGLVLSTGISTVALVRQLSGKGVGLRSIFMLRSYLSFTSGNYLATIMGILPLSVVPLEVLVVRGAAETARFAVAFLMVGFLNLIPATVAQVMFAESSRQGAALGRQLRKAIRGVYGLLLPALVVTIVAAPLLLRLFGAAYATAATSCLRVLALSTLLTGGTYLVDSLLIARDRTAAYVFMNGANAALVLGCVGILLPRGLTAAACGWALGQGLSLVLGLSLLATGRLGRHHQRTAPAPTEEVHQDPQHHLPPRSVIHAFEAQIQGLLETWPMMPTTLIAEQIGWNQPIQILQERVTELRLAYSGQYPRASSATYLPGQTAQCGLWFPPTEVPVGFGQTRSASQLPVLTVITGYSRWLSAILIPTTHPKDIFAGLSELLTTVGAVPKVLTWVSEETLGRWGAGNVDLTDECGYFCHAMGTDFIVGRSAFPETRELIERAHGYMERSFLPGRAFTSPLSFNSQLRSWLDTANTKRRQLPNTSPAELISDDRRAMLPLPSVQPPSGWHLSMRVGRNPFLQFDSNAYSVDPAVIGRRVDLFANLSHVRVLCNGKVAANHDRIWARECTVSDPAHVAAASSTIAAN